MEHRLHTILLLLCAAIAPAMMGADADPDSLPPAQPLPAQWSYDTQHRQTLPTDDNWWQTFHDATLDSLMARAVKANWDVALASRRIELARVAVRQASASLWPTLSASAGWQKGSSSGATGKSVTATAPYDYFSAGIDMSWEVDVFGRVAARRKLAKADLAVSEADYDAVIVSLCANLAKSYVTLRLCQAQMAVATAHIARQRHVMEIAEARFNCGLASLLDVTQARIVLYSTQATLPALEAQMKNTANSIALLCGAYPQTLGISLEAPADTTATLPDPFRNVAQTGVPADLLRRRPDVVEAEQQLAAYAAAVGVAKKDFLPTLSLTGSIGTSARRADNIFSKNSLSWEVAPQISWTIFDGLARNLNVAEARLNLETGTDNYNLTVMNAWNEVQAALNTYAATLKAMTMDRDVVAQCSKELDLSLDLYKRGLTGFTNVADAQMNYLTYQNAYLSERAAALRSLIELYQALGGGYPDTLVPTD